MKTLSATSIFTGPQSLNDFWQFIKTSDYSNIGVLVDENTLKYCYPLIGFSERYPVIETKSGEENKTIATCLNVWDQLSALSFDRKSLLVIVGGGVLCDMGGFIAATYLRGIDFVFIPTTLLSMCDSCLGGKTGVNFNSFKNQVGVFENSRAIFIHDQFLKTLPEKHFLSGYAEIIKLALVADKHLFYDLFHCDNFDENIEKTIEQSLKLKSKIVDADPFELNIRKSLNFGHSIGHGLESFFMINRPNEIIFHGEAIAAGMITEAWISSNRNMLTKPDLERICSFIFRLFPKLKLGSDDISLITDYIQKDKKNEHNQKLFSLPDKIGQCTINNIVTDEEIRNALEFYLSY